MQIGLLLYFKEQ
ncbi:hypothetical protein CIB84_005926 [Bambusicola thoracicus]|uniref:Uncharacterized protein n=1 Tax=Bambusicola thoracicus TaxID=9083 RepID=A0A2P4T1U0_BAMTH|nr:hypothetical protein CIB84_005926 [Bambusicola thoracicus]